MTTLSTHVLDTASGSPGRRIEVVLARLVDEEWVVVGRGITDEDGRLGELGSDLGSGTYRLVFGTGAAGNEFYPEIHVVVAVDRAEEHYHIPVLLSPFGYTTYRGS